MSHLLFIHCITPLHVGTGQAVGTTDLPIARERSTNWPVIPGSSLKGVLKEKERVRYLTETTHSPLKREDGSNELPDWMSPEGQWIQRTRASGDHADRKLTYLFGSPDAETASAGALTFSDAMCLFFPVRSYAGTFAYVTCPLALQRLSRLAKTCGTDFGLASQITVEPGQCLVPETPKSVVANGDAPQVILEDIEIPSGHLSQQQTDSLIAIFCYLDLCVPESRVVVLDDSMFTYFVENATDVTTHVSLEFQTRTAREGFLRSEERVPAEAVFVSLLIAEALLTEKAAEIRSYVDSLNGLTVQIGGKTSVGNGLSVLKVI